MSGPENNKLPDARPALAYIDDDAVRRPRSLNQRLSSIQPGRECASEYQRTVLEILNYLFNPTLSTGNRKFGL